MLSKSIAALLFLACSAGAASAQGGDPSMAGPGDAAHGQALFQQRCSVCHVAEKGGNNGVGPALYGAFGRAAGQAPGYAYSDKLKASGVVWTPDKLNQWLQRPGALVPGVKMMIPPVSNAQDRADIIAFLKTESDVKAPPPPARHQDHEHGRVHPHAH